MARLAPCALLIALILCFAPQARAEGEAERAAALDNLGRGTAAFRAGDMAAAEQQWSQAIRLAHLARASDLEVQALVRRGELYRTQGHLPNADADLRAALAEAEASGNQSLVAASAGALG